MKKSEIIFSLILVPLDVIVLVGAFLFSWFLRFKYDPTALPVGQEMELAEFIGIIIYIVPVWVVIFAYLGLYKISFVGKRISTETVKVFIASSASVLMAVIFLFGIREVAFSRLLLIYIWLFSFLFVFIERFFMIYLQRVLYRRGIGLRRVLLLVNGGNIEDRLRERLSRSNNIGYKLIGEVEAKDIGKKELGKVIDDKNPDIVLQADTNLDEKKVERFMEICLDKGIKFTFVPNLLDIVQTKTELADFFSVPLFIVHSSPLEGWGRVVKRLFDIAGSILAIILLSPVFIITGLLVKITSPGPMLYVQDRVGRDGKKFPLYKFRSMYQGTHVPGKSDWTTDNDSRITRFGKFIRETNLDEIPQFFNVLIGHMSLVGPRPEQPQYVREFSDSIPKYFSRHRVKSGITGWAQINGERGDRPIEDRVPYDMYYVNNWSLLLDIKIILITVWQVLTLSNRGEA
jgi:exopolysaccharide biosynthesis polyprenyl glycosylphosphotransferase